MVASGSDPLDRFVAAMIGRYGSIAVPGAALILTVLGIGMVTAPGDYSGSALYRWIFSGPLGPRGLGCFYLAVGAAALVYPCRLSAAALVAAHVGWGLACIYASVVVEDVSPTAWAYPFTVSAILFLSVRARGFSRSTRR